MGSRPVIQHGTRNRETKNQEREDITMERWARHWGRFAFGTPGRCLITAAVLFFLGCIVNPAWGQMFVARLQGAVINLLNAFLPLVIVCAVIVWLVRSMLGKGK